MFESFLPKNLHYKTLKNISTPFFVFDRVKLKEKALFHKKLATQTDCKLLYTIKAASNLTILKDLFPFINGFSVSSLFETQISDLASDTNQDIKKDILYISPGIREDQWDHLHQYLNFMTFNTLEQMAFFQDRLSPHVKYGIRLDPELIFLHYDYGSDNMPPKLGVPLDEFSHFMDNNFELSKKITGLHIHNAHMSLNICELEETFIKVESVLKDRLRRFKWLNLGGGYCLDQSDNIDIFPKLISYIRNKYNNFEILFIEPGASLVKHIGYLVTSVIDLFNRKKQKVALLDTTVNHLPEVLEFQIIPELLKEDGNHLYALAGCNCLYTLDHFGIQNFKEPLKIGSKVIFKNIGSYSFVKAHMFNGINLPDIYYFGEDHTLQKAKSFTFQDYISHFGDDSDCQYSAKNQVNN